MYVCMYACMYARKQTHMHAGDPPLRLVTTTNHCQDWRGLPPKTGHNYHCQDWGGLHPKTGQDWRGLPPLRLVKTKMVKTGENFLLRLVKTTIVKIGENFPYDWSKLSWS